MENKNRRYRLYLAGTFYISESGKIRDYLIVGSRAALLHAYNYGRDALVTDMHGNPLSGAKVAPDGSVYRIKVK